MIDIRFVADEAALQLLAKNIPAISELYIEENRCLSIVLHLDGKKIKLKMIPEVKNNKLSINIFKLFAEGININLSKAISLFKGHLEKFLEDKNLPLTVSGSNIIFDIDSNFAGISEKTIVINVRKNVR